MNIKVLDHGYVKYVDHLGSDEDIVAAARMSTGRGFVSWAPYKRCKKCDRVYTGTEHIGTVGPCNHDWQDFPRGDLGILEFMYKGKHMTPFEFGQLHIEVQAPIMVFREWHRHRTHSFSEFSARYSQMPNLHYLPEESRIQRQSVTNRQGSGEALDEDTARNVIRGLDVQQQDVYKLYDTLVNDGIAKEVARLNTPISRYSKMRDTTDLRNWLAFLLLRMPTSAQWEIRQYANAVAEIIKAIWPRTFSLFLEHDFNAAHFSAAEVALLKRLLSPTPVAIQEACNDLGWTNAQRDAFAAKFGGCAVPFEGLKP